jgi:hypothetical protein
MQDRGERENEKEERGREERGGISPRGPKAYWSGHMTKSFIKYETNW